MTGSTDDAGRMSVGVGNIARMTLDARACPLLYRLAIAEPDVFPALFESSAGALAQSRYDILMADPGEVVRADEFASRSEFFDAVDRFAESNSCTPDPRLPFVGGWLLYLGYEMAQGVEPCLDLPPATDGLPTAIAIRCTSAIIHDRRQGVIDIVSENGDTQRVAELCAYLECIYRTESTRGSPPRPVARWTEDPPEAYTDGVARARDYIHAGDVFQVNLARAWYGELIDHSTPGQLYAALRESNPAPFSALWQWGDMALICSSPERLLSMNDRRVDVRPIAGTRRRRRNSDHSTSHELITHPKERAEHVMLIDLVRNDIGRVCRAGSVSVDELMIIESYAHVHHIVSNVTGELASHVGPGTALRAVFPGGTITGCPKVRCMQIIAELELAGRGAYTGSIGYLSRCGRMDTNIVIRSLTQSDSRVTLRAGAGIVAESDPQAELEETRHKAHGVLRAFAHESDHARG